MSRVEGELYRVRFNLASSNFAGGLMAVASLAYLVMFRIVFASFCIASHRFGSSSPFKLCSIAVLHGAVFCIKAGGMLLAQGISSLQQQQLQLQQQQDCHKMPRGTAGGLPGDCRGTAGCLSRSG